MIDLNEINNINAAQHVDLQNDHLAEFDRDVFTQLNEQIENQFISFNNLGINLMADIPQKYQIPILSNLLEYCDNTYISIINIDDTRISNNKLFEVGTYVYSFLCVDCYNTFIPNYLESINCLNVTQFDIYYKNNLNNDASNVKTGIIKVIGKTIEQLLRLQSLDKSINENWNYKSLLTKFGVYMELVNAGDSTNFVFNYLRPILVKNEEDIVWRLT